MFFIIKARTFLTILAILGVGSCAIFMSNYKTEFVSTTPKPKYTVIIDAGHGGIDGGSSGVNTNVKESDLNLTYAKTLSKYLGQYDIQTILTRTTKDGLYDSSAKNLKKSDMKKRKQIIEQSAPTCVVSIHMNSYNSQKVRGAQVFYNKTNSNGKNLADCIQGQFYKNLPKAKQSSASGDYFIVNCTTLPAVIVECGFLSNPEEELLLLDKEYQNKLCYLITCGIVDYLNLAQ